MKKIIFILTVLIFQQNLYSQKEIVGKVEFYKSHTDRWKILDSSNDVTIEGLNSRKQQIELRQGENIYDLETDSTGVFKKTVNSIDSIFISINKKSSTIDGYFKYAINEIKDTLKIKISDEKLARQRDSVYAPDFFCKYSEKQANLDFDNGIKRILMPAIDWPTTEFQKKIRSLPVKYDLKLEYIYDPSQFEYRIMFRYNEVMRELIGIKENVW